MDLPLNEELGFYGVDGNRFKLGANVYEAIEDESDGYRSMLQEIKSVEQQPQDVFFERRLDTVKMIEDSDGHGYKVVSVKDGHIWLVMGTDNYDDYYPYFVFNYTPRAG